MMICAYGRFAYVSVRLLSVRLRLESIRLRFYMLGRLKLRTMTIHLLDESVDLICTWCREIGGVLAFFLKLEPLRGTYRGPVGHGIA